MKDGSVDAVAVDYLFFESVISKWVAAGQFGEAVAGVVVTLADCVIIMYV